MKQVKLSQYSDRLPAGWPGFDSWQGQEIFLISTASKPALGLTQPPVQWVPGLFPWGQSDWSIKLATPPASAKVKNGGAIPPLPHTS
jgi:hypothetical protein